jgi:TRAP-type C4-dicarboxylate transport system substrate-binding protein
MGKHMARRLLAAALGMLLVGASACSDEPGTDRAGGDDDVEPVVLQMAQPNHGDPPAQLQRWADEVEERTDGSLRIAFIEAWRLSEATAEAGTVEDVQAGEVDLAWVGARIFDRVGVNDLRALVTPMAIDSYELQEAVFEAGIPAAMLEGVREIDLVGVGVLPGPMRKVLGVSEPLAGADDFDGKVIGLQDSGVAEDALTSLGATPQALPSSADLDGVDGYEQQLSSIVGNRYWDVAKYVTANVNLWPRPLVIIAGEEIFQSLEPEHQAVLRDAAAAAVPAAVEESQAEDADAVPEICQRGMELISASDDDLASLRAAFEPVYDELRSDPVTADHLDAILSLKEETGAAAEAPQCEGKGTPDDPAAALPQGLFETTVTPQDWASAGFEGDSTTFTLEVVGDQVTIRDGDEVGFDGTYTVFRDDIEVTDGVDSFTARWSFDGTALAFTDVDPSDSPFEVVWASHPWLPVDP